MKISITILLVFIACNCRAQQKVFDTTLNVVSNGAKFIFKAKCDDSLLNYAAWDSINTCKFTMLIPNVPVAGRSAREIFLDTFKTLVLRYNLIIK